MLLVRFLYIHIKMALKQEWLFSFLFDDVFGIENKATLKTGGPIGMRFLYTYIGGFKRGIAIFYLFDDVFRIENKATLEENN